MFHNKWTNPLNNVVINLCFCKISSQKKYGMHVKKRAQLVPVWHLFVTLHTLTGYFSWIARKKDIPTSQIFEIDITILYPKRDTCIFLICTEYYPRYATW